jgi:hypothetical protein
MDWEYELTEQDYQQAVANGIKRETARQRFYDRGWEKERAITEPVNTKVDRRRWHRIAEENGITRDAFNTRLQRGWSEEAAATTPKQTFAVAREIRHAEMRKYPVEYIEKALKNGVSNQTFRRRVREGWDYEKASTTPTDIKKRRKELTHK